MTLLLLLFSCGPKKDAAGCWTDGEAAYRTVVDALCATGCGGATTEEESASCVEQATDDIETIRQRQCFDGCGVDECVDRLAKSCTWDSWEWCLDEGPFWDAMAGGRPCDEVGW